MKRFFTALAFCIAAFGAAPAWAQNTTGLAITACGTVPNAYTASTTTQSFPGPFSVDINGRLCIVGTVTATQPTGTTTQAKVTIAVTSTYQQALASSATRKGCTIQYVAVAGTKGFVFFGSAPADTTTSFQLTNGQSINCQTPGVTLTDAVQVTATGTDTFVVTNQ